MLILNKSKYVNKKNIGRLLSFLLSIFFIVIIIYKIDIQKSISAFSHLKTIFILIPFLMILTTYLLDGVCQYVLLNSKMISIFVYVGRVMQAQLFSIILPGRVGDISLLYFFRNISKGKVIKTYFFSKLITVATALFFTLPLFHKISGIEYFYLFIIPVVFSVFLILSYLNIHKFWDLMLKFTPGIIKARIENIHIVNPSIKRFLLTIVITITRILITGYGSFLLLRIVGIDLSYIYALSIVAAVFLVGFIPITPMSIGIAELTYVYMYSIFGIDESVSITVPVTGRLLQLSCMLLFSSTFIFLPVHKNS